MPLQQRSLSFGDEWGRKPRQDVIDGLQELIKQTLKIRIQLGNKHL